jgi:hypothetical protein
MPRNGTSLEQKAEWMRERHSSQSIGPSPVTLISAERHYSVAEVSAMWNLSQDAVRKIFQNEPGVLVLGSQGSPHTRKYTTLRVPESVLQRVHRRLTNA